MSLVVTIDASSALESLDQGNNPESIQALTCLLDAARQSDNSNSFLICIHDLFPKAAKELRSILAGKIDSSRIRTCVTPKDISHREQDIWIRQFIYSLGHYSVSIDSALLSEDLLCKEKVLSLIKSIDSPREFKRIAFVSPIPPQKTGIANYTSELIDALSERYNIDIITEESVAQDNPTFKSHRVKAPEWLLKNHIEYESVIYQVGNSKYHEYQLPLIRRVPGVLVLHDFFLGDFQYYRFVHNDQSPLFERNIYASEGYKSVLRSRSVHPSIAINNYGLNYEFVRYATRIIVHSEYSRSLLLEKYDKLDPNSVSVIPHLRQSNTVISRNEARKRLGVDDNIFLACSFGVVTENKRHKEIVDAWNASSLSANENARMMFVGQYDNSYGQELNSKIRSLKNKYQFFITGWTDDELFETYLAASDMAIQLRKNSRGETSGTVLDCMKYSVPLIINKNGSMAEIPEDCAYMLRDDFDQHELTKAMEALADNKSDRDPLCEAASSHLTQNHSPDFCAQSYADAMTASHLANIFSPLSNVQDAISEHPSNRDSIIRAASYTYGGNTLQRTVFVDVTATSKTDNRTGIERTAISLIKEMILSSNVNFRIEPVYLDFVDNQWTYRHARAFTYEILGIEDPCLDDSPFEPTSGDFLVALDYSGINVINATDDGLYKRLNTQGVSVSFLVHDILPVTLPSVFPPDANVDFERWLLCLAEFCDQIIGVTDHVAQEAKSFMLQKGLEESEIPRFSHSHHGADFDAEETGITPDKTAPNSGGEHFLMVGTLEPRKRYDLALDMFEELWQKGDSSVLLIVGREGWAGLPDSKRRNIPDLIGRIKNHPELGHRLFWFSNASDQRLDELYRSSDALLALSEDEGFGLPLIEAAQKGLPVIARDIPVFREVAGSAAYFIEGHYPIGQKDIATPKKMAMALAAWSLDFKDGKHPKPETMTWKSWRASAEHLFSLIKTQGS